LRGSTTCCSARKFIGTRHLRQDVCNCWLPMTRPQCLLCLSKALAGGSVGTEGGTSGNNYETRFCAGSRSRAPRPDVV
jgi:hypothetical protein